MTMAELLCTPDSPQWLELRRQGITATDIVTIARLVTWDSPWALYHRKLGLLPEVQATDRMRLGSWLEDAIAEKWASDRADAWDVEDGSALSYLAYYEGGLYRSTERRWQLATPDYVRLHMMGAADAVLECKTSSTRDGWGPDGTDQVPEHVRVQVLWQMDTLDVPVGHVAVVFLPSGEFRSYTIRHDPEQIDGLRDLGFGFWSRIQRHEPPDLDGLEVTTEALRTLHPAPHDQAEIDKILMASWDVETDAYQEAKRRLDYTKNLVRAAMGDATEATVNGQVVFRRTIGKRAGYTVAPTETDTLRRVGKGKADE